MIAAQSSSFLLCLLAAAVVQIVKKAAAMWNDLSDKGQSSWLVSEQRYSA
jgi:hypothetical protein